MKQRMLDEAVEGLRELGLGHLDALAGSLQVLPDQHG
jgi:hypothetical protein